MGRPTNNATLIQSGTNQWSIQSKDCTICSPNQCVLPLVGCPELFDVKFSGTACDLFWWKISPRNLASITTLSSRISGWGKGRANKSVYILFLKQKIWNNFLVSMCQHCLHRAASLFPLCINDLPRKHEAKSSTNQQASVPFKTDLTMLFILMIKRAGDRMLPCGAPISCSCSSDKVEPTLSLKCRWDRNLSMKSGLWPLKPKSQRSDRMPYFHVVS